MIRSVWNAFLRLNLIAQTLLALTATMLVALAFGLAIVWAQPSPPTSLTGALAVLLMDKATPSASDQLKALYGLMAIVLLTVWQAVFLMRIITRGHEFRFSTGAALYPHDPLRDERSDPIIVFRLLNRGGSDLFDVTIDVTLRVFNPRTAVFQHFRCRTINGSIPVFRRGMPFWIAVETGEVQVRGTDNAEPLDRAHLFSSHDRDGGPELRLVDAEYAARVAAAHQLDAEAFALIVFVLGHDVEMNQAKAGTRIYPLADVQPGFFRSIPPRTDGARFRSDHEYRFFSRTAIDANFDIIDPLPVAEPDAPPAATRQQAVS